MKVYVINLDTDGVKLKAIDTQLVRLGVPYKRVPGVYAKEMPKNELLRSVNRFRWWSATGRSIASAEIGCALSHFAIYQDMTEPVCILEDDVIIDNQFIKVLQKVEAMIDPSRAQVVMLSDHTGMYSGEKVAQIEVRKSRTAMCTDGYVLTPTAAKVLLAQNFPLIVPCDSWGRWVSANKIELFHALPSCISQNQTAFGTSTAKDRIAVSDFPPAKWIIHKFKRLIGKVFDKLLMVITGK